MQLCIESLQVWLEQMLDQLYATQVLFGQMQRCIESLQVLLESLLDRLYATQVLLESLLRCIEQVQQMGYFFDRFLGLGRLGFQV
jgi:hypothetical protein